MFPQYVVHSMEGRARLRHPALAEVAVRSAVQAALGREEDVLEVRPGSESMLLMLKPGVNLASLCQRLEQNVPILARPQAEVAAELRATARARRCEQWRNKGSAKSARAALGSSLGSRGDKRNILGISQRKLEVRAMLGVAGVCLASGMSGPKPLHLLAGLAWALMASRHVWVRRKAL